MASDYNWRSTDAGAPSLSGTAGALLAVWQALLQDGYNSKTVTLTSTGTVCTATEVGHGFVSGQRLTITGANEPEYNLSAREITVVDNDTFEYTLDSATTSPATGSISAIVSPLGWLIDQSNTNVATFIHSSSAAHLALDDTGTTNARVRGFAGVTTFGVAEASGSDPFPLDAQVSGGLYVMKSATANGTARAWEAHADIGSLYFHFIVTVDTNIRMRFGFGLFPSYLPGDAYNYVIEAEESASNSANPHAFALSAANTPGCYTMRDSDQTTSSGNPGRVSASSAGGSRLGNSGFTYPAPNRGGIILDPVLIRDPVSATDFRGIIYGLWNPLHNRPLTHGDTFNSATGVVYPGKSFKYFDGQSAAPCSMAIDTSNDWSAE